MAFQFSGNYFVGLIWLWIELPYIADFCDLMAFEVFGNYISVHHIILHQFE
jgi:hypothetical protein